MCLPVKPFKIEREWVYRGLKCAVVQAREAAHRCGYVRVPPGHPAHGSHYDGVDVSVHGGLTFSELEPCAHEDGQGHWLGFDCAHFMDSMYDPDALICELAPRWSLRYLMWNAANSTLQSFDDHYWLEDEVAKECECLADQLLEMHRKEIFEPERLLLLANNSAN